jgi:tyrosyl-tRNA synthetase
MSDLFAELKWRGFLSQATQQIERHLTERRAVYCGFDPTAPSFQVGNLMPLMLLRRFQFHGHRPIVLMGGGTGLIGDPSGGQTERPLLSKEEIRQNVHRQRDQLGRLFDFDSKDTRALVLNNADWLVEQRLVDFLRDIGKHFSVNVMMQKESVKARLDSGISYTEFSYMLLQAYDFLHLFRSHQCTIQVGGSDQWGNITAGIDLIRRVASGEAHGLVGPLFTTASGAKFGKTAAGAVWLDPELTSPYRLYQFWVNSDDRDAEQYLKLFTDLAEEEIKGLSQSHHKDPSRRAAQKRLAMSVTTLVHGDAARAAGVASDVLFGDFDPHAADGRVFDVLAREIPTTPVSSKDTLTLVDAVVQARRAEDVDAFVEALEDSGAFHGVLPHEDRIGEDGLLEAVVEGIYMPTAQDVAPATAAPAPAGARR